MQSSNRVAGGHKVRNFCFNVAIALIEHHHPCYHPQAAMHNPNVSAEAKEHSRQVVEEMQGSDVAHDDGTTTEPSSRPSYSDKDENRVLGGYKATLKSQFSLF
jgi:Conidiation protein 6